MIDLMAKGNPRKKKPFQMRLHPLLRQQLERLAERNATDMTEEVTRAIRERLEREGLWPPPAPPAGGAERRKKGKE
jgi:hypothetical protein